jgi:hypothetical protein
MIRGDPSPGRVSPVNGRQTHTNIASFTTADGVLTSVAVNTTVVNTDDGNSAIRQPQPDDAIQMRRVWKRNS